MPLQIPDQTIASQVPDGMTSLGSMLDMRSKALQLRRNTATFDADVAQRQAESSTAQSSATVNAANVQPLIAQQAAATGRTQTALASDQFKLSGEYLDKANQIAQGLISDPAMQSGDINAMLPKIQAAKQRMIDSGVPAATAEVQAAHLTTAAVANPKGVVQLLKNSILQSQPSTQQSTTIQPSVLQTNNGQQTVSNNVNPFAQGGVGSQVIPPVQQLLPPGQQESIATDALGNPSVVKRNPAGAITSTGPVPGGPGGGGFQSLPPGETGETLKIVQGMRSNANQAAASAPDQQFNTNQIIKYAGESDTGSGAALLANIKGGYAVAPWTSDKATNLNLLGHSMAQQQASVAQSAGLNGTNASRDLAKELTSDQEWTAPAIQSASRVMRAIGSTGAQLYNSGMENAVAGLRRGSDAPQPRSDHGRDRRPGRGER